MAVNRPFDPVFQAALPLPLARLYVRAHHAKGDRERHDHAFHLVEATLKLAAAALVARYRSRGERSPKVDAALRSLARPSLGQWRSIYLEILAFLSDGVRADPWARGIHERLRQAREDLGEALSRLAKAAQYKGRAIARPTALDLLDLLPTYRNAMSDAHGGIKADPEAYREPTPAILALAHALLSDGAILGGGRLVYAEEVRIGLQGEERVQWMDLLAMGAIRRQPMEGEAVREKVFPGRLYLEIPGGEHLPLYPLLHYQPGEILDEVFFLNRAREGAGGIQFLSYSTGEFYLPGRDPVGDALLKELKELLSWITLTDVTASRFVELATTSRADAQKGGDVVQEEREPSGTVLGDFEILGELGRGGMAVVYLARQMSLNRQVALKVLPPAFGNDPVALARFKQEVRALSWCDHPNVVKILSSGEAQGTHYYAMEFIDGGDLGVIEKSLERYRSSGADVLREEHFDRAASSASSRPEGDRAAGLPEAEKLEPRPVEGLGEGRNIAFRLAAVIRDAARGVHHVHEHGIVHRDLKPQNIMVTRSEHRPVVMDLGLAKVSDLTRSLTLDKGSILGTLRYMPPEQLQRNLLEVDARADVYALGAVLYEMVCLRPMLDGDSEERLTTQILFEEPPPAQKVNPRLPTDLATIIAKATRKDPKERYGSAAELADDLDRFVHGEAVSAKPPTLRYLLGVFVKKHRAAVMAAGLAVVLFALALAFWIVSLRAAWKSEQTAREAAQEQTTLAQDRLTQVLRLSDAKDLETYRLEAEGLWPASPSKVEALEAWLARARALAERLPGHRRTLDGLREKALPYSEEAAKRDRESHARAAELTGLLDSRKNAEEEIAKLEGEVSKGAAVTLLDYGVDEKKRHPTYYFRHSFEVEAPEKFTGLRFSLLSDGAVLYLNGKELLRDNMPDGAIRYGALAVKEYEDKEEEEYRAHEKGIQAIEGSLLKGRNLLAVEVHQAGRNSSDLRFDLEALGLPKEGDAASLVKRGSTWRYSDRGEDLGEAWRAPVYDESSWKVGAGPFGYGFSGGPGKLLELKQAVGKLGEKIAGLEKEVGVRRTWEFAETRDRWWHDALRDLVQSLEAFADPDPFKGAIASVEKRREFARTVRKRSLEETQARWDEAVASIRNKSECPKYGGLAIKPQEGLVPVGRDSESGLWEFAHIQSGEAPERGGDGKLALAEETAIVFVLIPGGTFRMGAVKPDEKNPEGSPNVDPGAEDRESPVKEISLSPFFLSKFEMTQGQWWRFTGKNPSNYGPDANFGGKQNSLLNPVEQVSWEDCKELLDRLGLVLPTEAQWEYAARAGTSTVWWTGNEKKTLQGAANIADSFCKKNGGPASWQYEEDLDDGYTVHAPVGSYRANSFGLHDVMGNVWEWCRDWYGSYELPVKAGDGERRVQLAGARTRVSRGGSFDDTAVVARSASRNDGTPGIRSNILGLRPARVITE